MLNETRRNCEREIFALAVLADFIAGDCHPNLGMHQDPVYFSTLPDVYFGSFRPLDLIRLPLLHAQPNSETIIEDSGGAVPL